MLFLSVCVLFSLCLSVGPARAAASVGGEINLMISYCGWCSLTAGESPGDAVSLLREQRRAQIISPAAFIYCSTYCCIIITPSSLPPSLPPPHRAASSHFPPSLSLRSSRSLVSFSVPNLAEVVSVLHPHHGPLLHLSSLCRQRLPCRNLSHILRK